MAERLSWWGWVAWWVALKMPAFADIVVRYRCHDQSPEPEPEPAPATMEIVQLAEWRDEHPDILVLGLLALIHRDSGEHTEHVGVTQSAEEAMHIVIDERGRLSLWEKAAERVKERRA